MKIIQTLDSHSDVNFLIDSFGWYAPEYHLMSWALSCMQLKKYHQDVHLYTNNQGAKMLIDLIQLPYDQVHTVHNDFILPHKDLWALPKIFTYSLQKKSFLHVDGDVFIFKKFSNNFLQQPLIAQNEEIGTDYYISVQKKMQNHFNFFPESVKKDFERQESIHAVNAGILGGTDIEFFKEYTDLAFEYVVKNKEKLSLLNASKFNVFFEQHLFYCYAKYKNKPITYLLSEIFYDNEFTGLGDFWEVPWRKTFLHLLGEYKKNIFICKQMAGKLRNLYPEYYYKIISIFKENGIPIKHDYYSHIDSSDEEVIKKHFFISKNKFYLNNNIKKKSNNNSKEVIKKINSSKENKILTTFLKKYKNRKKINIDYNNFIKKLKININRNNSISLEYLYGRDIDAMNWYRIVFGKEVSTYHQRLIKCSEVSVISSKYNWGAFWCGLNQIGVPYYKSLELTEGEYSTMIIPEAYKNGFSIYDLETLDVVLLELLTSPLNIRQIFDRIKEYFEDDVIENKMSDVKSLIISLLKRLILKKAIKPYFGTNETGKDFLNFK